MPTGGPTIGGAWAEGYSRAREHAIEETRHRLEEGLRIQKELRVNDEAVARETLKMRQAQALAEQTQAELQLLQQREAEVQASPGKPYAADPYLADKMLEAERNHQESLQDLETRRRNMMEMVYQRNQVIEQKAIPWKGGMSVTGWGSHQQTPEELEEEGRKTPKGKTTEFSENLMQTQASERADPEGQEFEKSMEKERKELGGEEAYAEQQQTRLLGLQRRQDVGREKQQEINKEEREKQLYQLEERATGMRARGLESQGGIEAAAQEIAARQRENQFIRSQQVPGAGGGQGTGLLGLLGSLINKAGGAPGGGAMGSPGGTSGGGGASGGKAGAAPSGPQVPRGGAPTPPQRPMTPMQFGQGGAPTPPPRPGVPGPQQPGVPAAGQPGAPTPPTPPIGMGAPTPPPRPPTLGQALGAATQHPIMNVPINQVPEALTQLLGPGRAPPPGSSGSPSLGGAQTYPGLGGPQGPPRPQAPPQQPPSMTPGGPAPGAPQPGAYGQAAPRSMFPSGPQPYSPPFGEPGGPGSLTLAGRGNIAPGDTSTGVSLPGVGGEGALRPPPAVAQAPPARPPPSGAHPIYGAAGDLPSSYRAAIGQGAVSPYAPMPPRRPATPLPPPRPPGIGQPVQTPPSRPQVAAQPPGAPGGVSQQARQAIANIESRGSGDYGAINKKSGAIGRYQVMPANVPSWTKQALGRAMTPREFAANPQAQEAVFNHIFGGYEQKYGPRGAAIKWQSGKAPQERPASAAGRAYAAKFEREGGVGAAEAASAPGQESAMPSRGGFHDIKGEAGDIQGLGQPTSRVNLFSGGNWRGQAFNAATDLSPINVGGKSTEVNKWAAPHFQGFINELAQRGYKIDDLGGYNYRNKRDGTSLSEHAFGNAIDINPSRNTFGGNKTDLPADVSQLAAKYGLSWGGDWRGKKDFMHFEWTGQGGGATPSTTPGGATPSATGTQVAADTSPQPAERAAEQRRTQPEPYQPPPPPEMPEHPPQQPQQPWQPPQQQAAQGPQRQRPSIGPPTVHDEQEIAGMKPGSIFRTPDGRLKVVPLQPLQRPQQAASA